MSCVLLYPAAARAPQEGDSLQFVGLCSPTDSCLIAASDGYAHHFRVEKLRRMGRTAAGTRVGTSGQALPWAGGGSDAWSRRQCAACKACLGAVVLLACWTAARVTTA